MFPQNIILALMPLLVHMVRVRSRLCYPLNLYVHLEVATGSVPAYHSRRYRDHVASYLSRSMEKRFLGLAKGYDFSLSMKMACAKARKTRNLLSIPEACNRVQWGEILREASRLYLPFWRKEARPSLVTFQRAISTRARQVEEGASLIAALTGRRWSTPWITVLPVYAISDMFGFGGQPIGNDLVMVGVVDPDLAIIGVLHEIAHLNLGKSIDLVASGFECEPDILAESVANMLTGTLVKRLHLHLAASPGVHGPDTEEYRRFLDKFEEYNELIRPVWSRYLYMKEKDRNRLRLDAFLKERLYGFFPPKEV